MEKKDLSAMASQFDAYMDRLKRRDPALMAEFKAERDAVADTFLQNWPKALTDLSIPQAGFELTGDERKAIIDSWRSLNGEELEDSDTTKAHLEAIKAKMAPLIAAFPAGAFVRLGSRSPKDSWLGMDQGFRVTDANRAISLLIDSMERIYQDLRTDDYAGATSWVFIREWQDMPAWSEFRCFMRERKLVGISQYNCETDMGEPLVHPEILADTQAIKSAIEIFFNDHVKPALNLEDTVFDVFVTKAGSSTFSARLLEINPFDPGRTYPGLFIWPEIFEANDLLFRVVEPTTGDR